jgi:hypothetical protein
MAFVTVLQSYDPTTHFETTVQDVLSMYTRITGKVSFLSFPSFSTVDDSRIWVTQTKRIQETLNKSFFYVFSFERILYGTFWSLTCIATGNECRTLIWVWIWVLQALPRRSKCCYIWNCFLPVDCKSFVILWSSCLGYFLRKAIYILHVYSMT